MIINKLEKIIDKFIYFIKIIGEFLYKYRFIIAAIIFLLCIILEISGSSIGFWAQYVNAGIEDKGIIFGTSRGIRSDEWAVFTPMMFSQKFDGFQYFSNTIGADKTDIFMIYGLPTLNLMQIFRPFQIGFLFLGLAKGLSFFWVGRIIALFLVSFEFGMILTKKDKLLSLVYAFMITLAPIIQWWFAVNGIAGIFIFGQLALILLYQYMNTTSFKKRIIYLICMIICAGGYVLVLYPAWQIPMFYVFLVFAIWEIIENRKNCEIKTKDIVSIIVALLIFIGCMCYVFIQSFDTIKTITNTVYPATRVSTGGEGLEYYFKYIIDIFLPVKDIFLKKDPCSTATIFGLFPIGIILAITTMKKNKEKDTLLIGLLITYVFFSIYCIFGFPKIISQITLLSYSPAKRTYIAVGILDILILIRTLAIMKQSINRILSIILSVINCTNTYPNMERWKKLDSNNEYEEIYNRYAHIRTNLVSSEDEYDKKFELLNADSFSVNIVPEDLKKLDVKYIFSSNNFLEDFETKGINFEMIHMINGFYIYEISYNK